MNRLEEICDENKLKKNFTEKIDDEIRIDDCKGEVFFLDLEVVSEVYNRNRTNHFYKEFGGKNIIIGENLFQIISKCKLAMKEFINNRKNPERIVIKVFLMYFNKKRYHT